MAGAVSQAPVQATRAPVGAHGPRTPVAHSHGHGLCELGATKRGAGEVGMSAVRASRSWQFASPTGLHGRARRVRLCAASLAISLALLVVLAGPANARAALSSANLWVPNGMVRASALGDGVAYLGGDFTRLSPRSGPGVALDPVTGAPRGFDSVVGEQVRAAEPDGSGGWFIGGVFTTVGGLARGGLAHVLADGRVDSSWHSDTDGRVDALVLSGGRLYVGGSFARLAGGIRHNIGAVDAATGALAPWSPDANGVVARLAVGSSVVYAAGQFYEAGGAARTNLAALDAVTGQATGFDAGLTEQVLAMALSGGRLYLGGDLGLKAVDAATGQPTGWDPGLRSVQAIAVRGSTVYVGGGFLLADGGAGVTYRRHLAAFDASTGALDSWDPGADGDVGALAVDGGRLFVGGTFEHAGGQARSNLASFDLGTGALEGWDPQPNDAVRVVASAAGSVYVGGMFSGLGGVARNGLAAIDLRTGQPTGWDPGPSLPQVTALLLHGPVLYVAGGFVRIGGQARERLAALSTATGQAEAFDPGPLTGRIQSLAIRGDSLFAAGQGLTVGSDYRGGVAAFDAGTGQAKAWRVDVAEVNALALSGSTLYLGGPDDPVNGQQRNGISAVDADTGALFPWNPILRRVSPEYYDVASLAVSGTRLYVGFGHRILLGAFGGVAAFDTSTGQAAAWDPQVDGPVSAIGVSGSTVYLGGPFTHVSGRDQRYLAAVSAYTAKARNWEPALTSSPITLSLGTDGVLAGGSFAGALPDPQAYAALFVHDREAPSLVAGPHVDGTPKPGAALACFTGTWDNDPDAIAIIWLRDGTEIAGAGTDYLIGDGDRGHGIACRATASNSAGTAAASSPEVRVPPPALAGKPPAGVAKLLRSATRVTPRGYLTIPIRCTGPAPCQGTLTLTVRKNGKALTVGRRHVLLQPGPTARRLWVRLTAAGRRLVIRARRLSLTATFAAPGQPRVTARIRASAPSQGRLARAWITREPAR